MLLRWNKKKFSIGAGTTAQLMPKRLCLVVSSRSVRRKPEKLGRRWRKVWNKVFPGDRCWQSGVLVDQVCQQHEWVVPGIAARYRKEHNSSVVLQSYTVYALRDPQPVKADECVCDGVGAFQIEDPPCRCIRNPPTRRCRSPAGNALGQLPASGMWR